MMAQDILGGSPRRPTLATLWLRTLLHPSIASFAALGQEQAIRLRAAYAWIFVGGLLGAAIQSLPEFETQLGEGRAIDMFLVSLIPAAALISVSTLAAFAWCTHGVARLLRGTGSHRQLAGMFAAFSAPLLAVASIIDLVPPARVLLAGVYVYWLALSVLAVSAAHRLSKRMALAAVLAALLGLGLVWLAGLLVALYSGLFLP